VTSIEIGRGQRVKKGDILLTLDDALQDAVLERVEREWKSLLREYLANPNDEGTRKSLAGLRARRQQELARVEQRIVRAPRDGVVANLRVRAGEHLGLGQTVLSIVDPDSEMSVIALLPGADRALLRPKMLLRVELPGYRDVQKTLRIESVDDEIIGPEEANRYLGEQLQGSFALSGPIAVVRARLDTPDFELDGHLYRFRDGMPLTAEVPVRKRRLFELLVPGD
jgi:membrane fusion protein (multidrug efflux system)